MSADESRSRVLALALAVAVVGMALGPTLALAGVVTDSANFGAAGNDELATKNVSVSDSTSSVYVELDDTDGNATGNVNVTFYGVENGSETQLNKVQLQPDSDNETELFEQSPVDSGNYSEYRVVAEANSSDTSAEYVTVGKFKKVAGAGGSGITSGSGLDMKIFGIPAVLVAAAGGAFLLVRRD
jgi:hypothetical protein